MIYVCSDLHFGHDRDFIYVPRGYNNVYDHDRDIIQKWNDLITDQDDVYILGDLMLGDNEYGKQMISQLNGNLHIIYGNHDTDTRIAIYNELHNVVEMCGYATMIKYSKWHFYLSHYPTKTANYDDSKENVKKNLWNLCGHVHTKDKFLEMRQGLMSYHVELDAHGNQPVPIDTVIQDIIHFSSDPLKIFIDECRKNMI